MNRHIERKLANRVRPAPRVLAAILLLFLTGSCADHVGERAASLLNDTLNRSYIPLHRISYALVKSDAAAMVIAPGVAVTNAHNADILGSKVSVIGTSRTYDLMFFRTERNVAPPTRLPVTGERVIAYGQDDSQLMFAVGVVRELNVSVEARCQTCMEQKGAFIYEGNAGPGFSGGPVVDAATGEVIGITFGYVGEKKLRLMYAYPMNLVRNELARVTGRLPTDVN